MKKFHVLAVALAALLCVLPLVSCAENGKVDLGDGGYEAADMTLPAYKDGKSVLENGKPADPIGTFTFAEGLGDTAILVGYEGDAIQDDQDDEVYVPSMFGERTVIGVGSAAFYHLTSFKKVVLPDTVTYIDANAFTNCINLETVVLSKNLTEIGESAFLGCESLTTLENLSEAPVTTIGQSAFWGCTALDMQLPATLESIGDAAFWQCRSLTEVIVPDSLKTIGRLAFYDCAGIETIRLNNNLEEIGEYAFVLDGSTLKDKIDVTGVTNEMVLEYVENIKAPTGSETGDESETESTVETEPVTGPEGGSVTEPATEPVTDPESESETEPESGSEIEPATEA